MADIHIKKGFNIRLRGSAALRIEASERSLTYALKPTDFSSNLTRPKLMISEGDTVKAGTPLLYDKLQPRILYTAPVSGEVATIKRGERRRLLELILLGDEKIIYEPYPSHSMAEIEALDKATLVELLLKGGLWPQLIQRPYGIVADPDLPPSAIFVSAHNTHPLAPDMTYALAEEKNAIQAALYALGKFAPIHLVSSAETSQKGYFARLHGVEHHSVKGPHPAGNVGVHIHHLLPVHANRIVWTLTPYGLALIGRFLLNGQYDTRQRIALTGPMVEKPCYYEVYGGASIKSLVSKAIKPSRHVRYVAGNVLTGERVSVEGHLGYYDTQITVLEEGDNYELFGWIRPSFKKLSFHRGLGLLSFLRPKETYALNTNTNGEHRAFVQTGAFERVLPMDILLMYLLKAIMAEDYESMEALGIYELIEEDVALCEFIDPSKHPIQKLIRKGIDMLREN